LHKAVLQANAVYDYYRLAAGTDMLRITITENALEQTWVLQGRLTKRSVAELVASWKAQPTGRCRIVDLNEVTSIDKSGEGVLLMMVEDGARFVASGVYTRHLLEQLQARQTSEKQLAGSKPN
jgi:ABC-type transporter Mla MlaB component